MQFASATKWPNTCDHVSAKVIHRWSVPVEITQDWPFAEAGIQRTSTILLLRKPRIWKYIDNQSITTPQKNITLTSSKNTRRVAKFHRSAKRLLYESIAASNCWLDNILELRASLIKFHRLIWSYIGNILMEKSFSYEKWIIQ